MIAKIDWLKPEEKPYLHQLSLDCNINHGLESRSRLKGGKKKKTDTGPHSLLSPAKRDLTARRHWG
ncbi:MAG: hypothetical protein JYX80_12390 [Candidatus Scalindua sediminis]|nr:hypothetical protein [Candidatus Scalindua sediminis]HDY67660.1 hypothetical protein [Candidatus Scalindua sp.]